MSIQEKLLAIQKDLKAPKDLMNNFGGYKYRSCESILEAVKPLLVREGLVLNLSDDMVNAGDRFYIKASASVTDGENTITSTAFAREAASKKGMDESQITGTASSYARKYALNGLFLIDDTKDADTNEFRGKEENDDREKAEKIAASTIDEIQVRSLLTSAERVGIPVEKILEKFNIAEISDMTQKQFRECNELINKQEKALKKAK